MQVHTIVPGGFECHASDKEGHTAGDYDLSANPDLCAAIFFPSSIYLSEYLGRPTNRGLSESEVIRIDPYIQQVELPFENFANIQCGLPPIDEKNYLFWLLYLDCFIAEGSEGERDRLFRPDVPLDIFRGMLVENFLQRLEPKSDLYLKRHATYFVDEILKPLAQGMHCLSLNARFALKDWGIVTYSEGHAETEYSFSLRELFAAFSVVGILDVSFNEPDEGDAQSTCVIKWNTTAQWVENAASRYFSKRRNL